MDVLAIREFVWELNEVFTDPSILKVLHGADMDIQWLQKDFGVYVVRASPPLSLVGQSLRHGPRRARAGLRVLRPRVSPQALLRSDREQGVPARGLAVGVSLWLHGRIRPLTRDMKKYAREDTHFLLYIADELRTLLQAQSTDHNLVSTFPRFHGRSARSSSAARSSRGRATRSRSPRWTRCSRLSRSFGGGEFQCRKRLTFNPAQTRVFALLFFWRDALARELHRGNGVTGRMDESPQFILPQISLSKLAHNLPRHTADLFRLLQPVPAVIRSHAREIVELVQRGLEGVSLEEGAIRDAVWRVRFPAEPSVEPKTKDSRGEEPVPVKSARKMAAEKSKLEGLVKEGAAQLQKAFHRRNVETW